VPQTSTNLPSPGALFHHNQPPARAIASTAKIAEIAARKHLCCLLQIYKRQFSQVLTIAERHAMTTLDLLVPVLTDDVKQMAINRVLSGGNLAPRGCDRRKAKLALLLVIELNPREVMKREEAALLYGISVEKLRDSSDLITHTVNL